MEPLSKSSSCFPGPRLRQPGHRRACFRVAAVPAARHCLGGPRTDAPGSVCAPLSPGAWKPWVKGDAPSCVLVSSQRWGFADANWQLGVWCPCLVSSAGRVPVGHRLPTGLGISLRRVTLPGLLSSPACAHPLHHFPSPSPSGISNWPDMWFWRRCARQYSHSYHVRLYPQAMCSIARVPLGV